MNTFQVAGAVVGVSLLWTARGFLRSLVQHLFPQGLPGTTNTASLASSRPLSAGSATAKDLENVVEYDYIIVGTGTAGCILANRLSEDPNSTVLAIESGHSDLKQLMSRIPAGVTKLLKTDADWAFSTTTQPKCDNRKVDWPRGKMIGGCSSINAMMYTRCAPADYDEWEELGNKGWAFKDVVKYMNKAEKFRQSDDPSRRLPPGDLAQHGQAGSWEIGYTYQAEVTTIFPDGCDEIGIPKTPDINTDRGILGAAPVQCFIDGKGQRASTAVAYLTADVIQRPNLKIATGQVVTKIVFDTTSSPPRAVGIEMGASKSANTRFLAKARKEVILCGGTIGSPQLLKLSGVGPAEELKSFNIPLVKELAGVGENLMDHVVYHGVVFKTEKEASLHYLFDPIKSLPAIGQWFSSGTGPATSQACDSFAFVRSAERDDILPSLKGIDHSSGPGAADLELMALSIAFIAGGDFIAPMDTGYGQLSSVCLRPESRGTVKLASADPFAAPLIDPNMLSTDYDIDLLLYGVRLTLKIAKSEAYKKHFKGWYPTLHQTFDWDTATDEQIKEHIRKTCVTLYHPMGTAKMGNGSDAVVDDQLRVHGVAGLRVVDASIFPTPVAGHTCAPVVMVAEKAADLIKNQWA